ncbi:Na+/H+ antiporter [Sphingobium amiense]|uniref:Na+/H+ antiporter n=1 Tax=Sphingobium amiense TaxID=135719 RepID=A0A494VX71_9SPHN|nr:Na+/H+ antiporter [Sphingobium amiense]BBD96993.1 Na+/H+ antiporter [Sphingobium amiense]
MSITHRFEIVLLLISASLVLTLAARRWRLPQAGALIFGGLVLALMPGMPSLELDPDLVLVLFLPPLLLLSAYLTDWRAFRADLRIILQLAVGAVLFTTLTVGWVTHWLLPQLPWAACFALGAIVSPPDAIAAKAILKGMPLPSRTVTLLEGESLLNDATGLVLYRFAVVAALTGTFSGSGAAGSFLYLVFGGLGIGLACGLLASFATGRVFAGELGVTASFLVSWGSYILGDALGASGVLATVVCGIIMGWRQHELLDAEQRFQSQAVWEVIGFILESFIFILIGLSLRSVLSRMSLGAIASQQILFQLAAVVATVVIARFIWIVSMSYGVRAMFPALRRRDPYPAFRIPLVMSWAGMRGVVSLAAALSLPDGFPGRDFILLASFTVILVTVVVQGATLAPLVRWLGFDRAFLDDDRLIESIARRHVVAAELAALERLSADDAGVHRHPRMVEQLRFRLAAITRAIDADGALDSVRTDHFDTLLASLGAGRTELIRMFRAGEIGIDVFRVLERELDADEIRARHLLSPARSTAGARR